MTTKAQHPNTVEQLRAEAERGAYEAEQALKKRVERADVLGALFGGSPNGWDSSMPERR